MRACIGKGRLGNEDGNCRTMGPLMMMIPPVILLEEPHFFKYPLISKQSLHRNNEQ
jgi:hypothetical protein